MKNITTLTKQVIALTLIIASFLSCENDDDISGTNLPKLVQMIGLGGSSVFDYGENGFLKKISWPGSIVKYTYNSDNQITTETFERNGPDANTTTYYYEDNKIISSSDSQSLLTYYFYNADSQLISTESNGVITIYNYDVLGRLTEKIKDSEVIESYEYDDKTNPFQFIFPEAFNKIHGGSTLPVSNNGFTQNNATSYTHYGSPSEYTYEYNSNGLPFSKTLIGFTYPPTKYVYE